MTRMLLRNDNGSETMRQEHQCHSINAGGHTMYQPKLAIIYYSSTGTNYKIAQVIMKAAEHAGAEVRLRKVRELAPESAIDQNPAWRAHHETAQPIIEATLEDLEWADAYIFGSPTRYGNIA